MNRRKNAKDVFYLNNAPTYSNGHQLIESGVPFLKCGDNTTFIFEDKLCETRLGLGVGVFLR